MIQSHLAKKSVRLSVQTLEDRSLAAAGFGIDLPPVVVGPAYVTASLNHGMLRVVGTNHDDNILVRQANGHITVSGVAGSFLAAQVSRIDVSGLAGNDVIRLNSETMGGQPIGKPSILSGGNGNDLIVGGYGKDSFFGNAGDDLLMGNNGNDFLDGGAGRDRAYGGNGNDYIVGDLNDLTLAGQAGTDVVTFTKVDPAPLAQGNPNQLKQALQMLLVGRSFSKFHDGEKITVSHMEVQNVAIVDGVTTLTLKARIRYQKTRGFPQFSETGEIRFTVQPQLNAKFVDGQLQNATIGLGNPNVLSVNLNHVPNWLDNTSEVRAFLTTKLEQQLPLSFTAVLATFLNAGGSIGPLILS